MVTRGFLGVAAQFILLPQYTDNPQSILRESPACTNSMEVPYYNFEVHFVMTLSQMLWSPYQNESTSGADVWVLCTVYYSTHIHEVSKIP